jgi:hypothetical protein
MGFAIEVTIKPLRAKSVKSEVLMSAAGNGASLKGSEV